MEKDEEYSALMKQLQQFPNYFQKGAENTTLNIWEKLKQKLLDEKDDFEEMSEMDRFRNLNLLGCVYYYLGDLETAVSTIEGVLKESGRTNINACAMLAKMYYIQGKITKSKEFVQKLEDLATDPYLIDIAKSELCYAWSRMHPKHYKKAIDGFKELISKYSDKPAWTFGLALMYRRCLHLSVKSIHPDLDNKQCFYSAKKLLEDNIHMKEIEPIYKARAYIELANLLALKDIDPNIKRSSNGKIKSLIVEGVELAPECASILMKAGKVIKYIYQFQQSEKYLRKAHKLRPNSFNCHQLALIIKSNIIFANRNINNSGRSYASPSSTPIRKRHGHSSMKWQNPRNELPWYPNQSYRSPNTTSTLDQRSHKETVVQELFKPVASCPKIQHDHQNKRTVCFNNSDLEEDNASSEVFDRPVLDLADQFVSNFKNLTLDPRPNKTTEIDFDNTPHENKSTPSTSERKPKEVQPNNRPCPPQSIQPYNPMDQPEIFFEKCQEDIPSSGKVPSKLSASAPEFVPLKVDRQIQYNPTMQVEKPTTRSQTIMKTIMKSPELKPLDSKVSQQLVPCLTLLEEAVYYSKETNFSAYYDWGLLLLQMSPPNYKEAFDKFNYVIQHDESINKLYTSYEQAGICKWKMSENKEDADWEYHLKDAYEMFKRAMRCWADCQRMKLHEYFDDAEQNCNSIRSMREILGDGSKWNTQQRKDLADIYHRIRQYGDSMELYEELHCELQQHSNGQDSDIIQGFIKNHLGLKQFDNVCDLLSLFMSTKEGFKDNEFKSKVLTEMMQYAIENNDSKVAGSVIGFDRDSNFSYDAIILYKEENRSLRQLGQCLLGWLSDIGFKVTCNTDTIKPGTLKLDGQGMIISSSKIAICIINDESQLPYAMEMALTDVRKDGRQIITVLLNDSKLPSHFKPFKSICIANTVHIDQLRTNILKEFCDIYLTFRNTPTLPQVEEDSLPGKVTCAQKQICQN